MTTQPERIALDDLTSDALDQLYDRIDALRERRTKRSHLLQELKRDNFALRMDIVALLEGFTVSEVQPGEISRAARAEARVAELEAEVARLTAGQCLDSRAMCEQHHAPPVDGCPYPRCRAARNRDQRAATA
ncbi:hypothetical protein ACFWNF_16165 [Streptomyces anulatus]|uniref:hypothetical protein n=1 Tax=Streptomyces anulatus TaxID=1892 RepID=UPI0036686B78